MYRRGLLASAALIGAGILVSGCSGGGSSAPAVAARAYLGTQAPGDVWD